MSWLDMGPEAVARGAAQGTTLGFMDEIAGAMMAHKNAMRGKPEVPGFDIQWNPWSQMQADYTQNRDAWRERDAAVAAENPKSFMGGNIAGALPMLNPTSVMGSAAAGGLMGYGGSTDQPLQDSSAEAIFSGGASAANPWLGMLAANVIKFPKKAIKKASEGLTDTPGDVVSLHTDPAKTVKTNRINSIMGDLQQMAKEHNSPTSGLSGPLTPEAQAAKRAAENAEILDKMKRKDARGAGEEDTGWASDAVFIERQAKEAVKYTDGLTARFLAGFDDPAPLQKAIEKARGGTEPYAGADIQNTLYAKKVPWAASSNPSVPIEDFVPNGILGKDVAVGGADPFAWMDTKHGLGMAALIAHKGKPLAITTRSDLLGHGDYLAHLDPKLHSVTFRLPNGNNSVHRDLAPGTPSFKRVLAAIEKLKERGVPVSVVFEDLPLDEALKRTNDFSQVGQLQKLGVPYRKEVVKLDATTRKQIESVLGKDAMIKETKSKK